jgi:hypothetical protein
MTIQTMDCVIDRIEISTEQAPIAVFWAPDVLSKNGKPGLNCMYANTIETQRWMQEGSYPLLGIFDGSMDEEKTRKTLIEKESLHKKH